MATTKYVAPATDYRRPAAAGISPQSINSRLPFLIHVSCLMTLLKLIT